MPENSLRKNKSKNLESNELSTLFNSSYFKLHMG